LFREKEAKDYILFLLGSVLSGDSVALQRFLVNYGKGSGGKSTLLQLIYHSLGDAYFLQIKSDAFCKKTSNKDKILNAFNSSIRYYVINEADTGTLDTSLLKKIAEGDV